MESYVVDAVSNFEGVPLKDPLFEVSGDKLSVYTANLVFLKLEATVGTERKQYNLVIKATNSEDNFLFEKESSFYFQILPELPSCRSVFVQAYPGKLKSKIVLDNMIPKGFQVIDQTHRGLGLVEAELVLKRIAVFHGDGLAIKLRSPSGENALVAKFGVLLKEAYVAQRPMLMHVYQNGLLKTLEAMAGIEELKSVITRFQARVSDLDAFWTESLTPREPLATLLHGDLWTSNMLFNEDRSDLRFIDLQVVRYGNPGLDISNFLCICVRPEVLLEHFPKLMASYTQQLFETLKANGIENHGLTAEDILADFRQHAVWGLHCAFQWLPLMMRLAREQQTFASIAEDIKANGFNAQNKPLADRFRLLLDFISSVAEGHSDLF